MILGAACRKLGRYAMLAESRCRLSVERFQGRCIVHFVHMGKTAGTALQNALIDYNSRKNREYYFVPHRHTFTISDVPVEEFCLFTIRDPIARFVSGFYSRRREGLPRLRSAHTRAEAAAFSRYGNAVELAEALCGSASDRAWAANAMNAIGHVKSSYWDWFRGELLLEENRSKVVGVLRQEKLSEDVGYLQKGLDLGSGLQLPGSSIHRHQNQYGDETELSAIARENLKRWYARDYAFIVAVEEIFGTPYARRPME